MLSLELNLLKGASLQGRAELLSWRSLPRPRPRGWVVGTRESPLHKHLPMGAFGPVNGCR